MSRVCKNYKLCKKVLIDEQGEVLNHPNKVVNEDGGTEWLCDECFAEFKAKKEAEAKKEPAKKEIQQPEPKKEVTPAPEKKAIKKGGKKK